MNNIDIFHTYIYTIHTKLYYTTPYTIVYFTTYHSIYKTSSIFLTSLLHRKLSQLINDSRIKQSIKIDYRFCYDNPTRLWLMYIEFGIPSLDMPSCALHMAYGNRQGTSYS